MHNSTSVLISSFFVRIEISGLLVFNVWPNRVWVLWSTAEPVGTLSTNRYHTPVIYIFCMQVFKIGCKLPTQFFGFGLNTLMDQRNNIFTFSKSGQQIGF